MWKQAKWYAEEALKRGKKIDSNVLWSFLADDQHAREHNYKLINNLWSGFVDCVKNIIEYFWWEKLKWAIILWLFLWVWFWAYKLTISDYWSWISQEVSLINKIITSTWDIIQQSWSVEKILTKEISSLSSWDNFLLTWN